MRVLNGTAILIAVIGYVVFIALVLYPDTIITVIAGGMK